MSDEHRFEETPEESHDHPRQSSRRRHAHESNENEPRRRSRHVHHEDKPRPLESVWDRSNWIFLLVLTNFISLAIGTHIGHRHWRDIKAWMGQAEHGSEVTNLATEPFAGDEGPEWSAPESVMFKPR